MQALDNFAPGQWNGENLRQSLVFLRSEHGQFLQMQEDQFMRLQLEDAQRSAAMHIRVSDLQKESVLPIPELQLGDEKSNFLKQRQTPQPVKKASLIVNISKKQEAQRNDPLTIRRNSATVQNTQQSMTMPSPHRSMEHHNLVHLNGIKYFAVNLKDIPENAQIIATSYASVPKLLQSFNGLLR